MLNSEPPTGTGDDRTEQDVAAILRSGAKGAVVLAGLATAIVVAIWLLFYLFVFLPRAVTP